MQFPAIPDAPAWVAALGICAWAAVTLVRYLRPSTNRRIDAGANGVLARLTHLEGALKRAEAELARATSELERAKLELATVDQRDATSRHALANRIQGDLGTWYDQLGKQMEAVEKRLTDRLVRLEDKVDRFHPRGP